MSSGGGGSVYTLPKPLIYPIHDDIDLGFLRLDLTDSSSISSTDLPLRDLAYEAVVFGLNVGVYGSRDLAQVHVTSLFYDDATHSRDREQIISEDLAHVAKDHNEAKDRNKVEDQDSVHAQSSHVATGITCGDSCKRENGSAPTFHNHGCEQARRQPCYARRDLEYSHRHCCRAAQGFSLSDHQEMWLNWRGNDDRAAERCGSRDCTKRSASTLGLGCCSELCAPGYEAVDLCDGLGEGYGLAMGLVHTCEVQYGQA